MTNTEAIAEIGVTLHEGALTKVSRFYNGTEDDIMPELFQNARRAGATRVEVETNEETGIVTVRDDGGGISDYRAVLGFGQSEWTDSAVLDEDPAGMGLFSLARRRWDVTSRRAGEEPWTVAIGPEHFDEGARATVYQADPATPTGTTVRFGTDRIYAAAHAARAAARFYPLSVVVDGEEADRSDFLLHAVRQESWRGLTFGVYREDRRANARTNINFHGVTIQHGQMPRIPTLDDHWSLLVDIEHVSELSLVLPARKEVVASPFLDEMSKEGRLVLLRAIAEADPPARISAELWREIRDAGIAMPEPEALLQHFYPREADWTRFVEHRSREPFLRPRPNSMVVAIGNDLGPAVQQTFMRAAERAGIDERLFGPVRDFAGFEWYDRLPRLTGIAIVVTINGEEHRVGSPAESDTDEWLQGHAEQITLECTVEEPAGRQRVLTLESDVALVGDDAWQFGEDCHMLVTRDTTLTPTALTNLLVNAFFEASDDLDADSFGTQRGSFEEAASSWALEMLVSPEEALSTTVAAALKRVSWQLRGRGAVARIDKNGVVTVRLGRKPETT